jgi:cytidylate kinase
LRARGLVVAIDGPSGAGKSSAGRRLAERLGYTFIDTGAMYRALAYAALRAGSALDHEQEVAALAHRSRIELADQGRRVLLDGEDVTQAIRSQDVSAAASRVSKHPAVRRELVARQRELGREGGVVLDGRDIGTAVFPDAEVKLYVDADVAHRAQRRHDELLAAGVDADLPTIEREVRERDHADMTRADSPLTRAPDAVHLDTTELTLEQVVDAMLDVVRERGGASGRGGPGSTHR